MNIAVLAVQGAFIEHEQMLQQLGANPVELRKKEDLAQQYDGIILPGGESTVQGKLLRDLDMYDTLKKQIQDGMPVLATCAGMILLSEKLESGEAPHFGTLPVTVRRNAYGRQLGSFFAEGEVKGIGTVPMTFIRAPYISSADPSVKVLAKENDHIIAVQYKNQLALSFHPELNEDTRLHRAFLDMAARYAKEQAV